MIDKQKLYQDCECISEHELGICGKCLEHSAICPDNGTDCCGARDRFGDEYDTYDD